jgi:2-polyprenyl-6-methoxyphenol hydroxylase-like FAD-dependent oxidoreductase
MSMAGAGPDGSAMALSMTNKSTVTVELVEK